MDKSNAERCGYFLVGETLLYGTDNGEYEKTRRKRIDTFGEDLVGNNESYAWIGQTMPEELGRANSHRKNKKTIWTIIGSALGIGIISALGNQNGGGSPDVGGESGSPTGR